MTIKDHPTILNYKASKATRQLLDLNEKPIDAGWLKQLCLDAGADDAGFVSLDDPAIADQKEGILQAYPKTRALISLVARMNRAPIQSPARSIANREFHTVGHDVDDIAHHIVRRLEDEGIGALNPSMAFPMEMERFPDKQVWVVSHKPVAQAAGMGVMGIHRNVIHPKFGNFILLGTILLSQEVSDYGTELDFNPCFECKLCVAACPVGAISSDGHFNGMACMTHNYREFFGGFVDWAEKLAESKNVADYREDVTLGEDASRWQSLSYNANYKAAYCMAVCPAGEDVIGPYLDDKKLYLNEVVKPLQQKEEVIYATAQSDALPYTQKRYPHKTVKIVKNGIRPQTVEGFLYGATISFQRNRSEGLNATYHFTFTGDEAREATFDVRDKILTVSDGLIGEPDLHVTVDSRAWIALLNKHLHPVWAIVTRRLRFKGDLRLLLRFNTLFG